MGLSPSRLHRKDMTGTALGAPLGLSALCLLCLVLSAPLARASSFSAVVAGPTGSTGMGCTTQVANGGSGSSSASVASPPCLTFDFFGGALSTVASASGSWITGDFSASAQATADPATGHGASIGAFGTVGCCGFLTTGSFSEFSVSGLFTLPPGMTSATVTLGVTGLSGTVGGLGLATGYSAGDMIALQMMAGGSASATSVACMTLDTFSSFCPGSGTGLVGSFGPGALAPVQLTVNNGELLQLTVSVEAEGFANASTSSEEANASIFVDPLYLDLGGGTFDSGITGFLSGPGPSSSVPEPGTNALILTGLALLLRKRALLGGLWANRKTR